MDQKAVHLTFPDLSNLSLRIASDLSCRFLQLMAKQLEEAQ